jgi:hypothetical protein
MALAGFGSILAMAATLATQTFATQLQRGKA